MLCAAHGSFSSLYTGPPSSSHLAPVSRSARFRPRHPRRWSRDNRLTIAILYDRSKTPRRVHLLLFLSLSLSSFFFFLLFFSSFLLSLFCSISFRSKATRATYYLHIDDSQSWQQIEGGEANSARNRLSLLQRRRYHESRSTTNARDADAASLTLHCGQRYTSVLLFQKLPPLLSNR